MVLEGKSVFGGIAIGRLSIYNKKENQVKREKITDVEAEITRFTDAKETAKEQLKGFYEKAVKEVGEVNAAIFEVHQMMLDDLDYVESITNMIRTQEVNAEFAVASTGDNFSKMFAAMDDDYMKERAADVKDISNRVISILQNAENGSVTGEEPVILLADDLAPSETVQLDKSKVLSFVTRHGSTNSHTAILARTMNIPALIGIDFSEDVNGKMGIVDGYTGKLYIEPDEEAIRTLDIGADKQVDYFHMEKEENPAMGYRAIRICLDRPEIFKTQLRAIYRASYYGTISIMFPMIISVKEVKRIKEIVAEVKAELTAEGIPFKDCELGIMIETPAAVMISDLLAEEVDFFSIGTNDLTQYTLAIDRQNPKLDSFYDSHHEAILRMLQMVVDNGHKHGCWVGICGELGADTTLTSTFLKMGFDELSVSPAMILRVREEIRNTKVEE